MSIDAKSISTGFKRYPVLFVCGLISFALLVVLYMRSDLISLQEEELSKATQESSRHRSNLSNAAWLPEHVDFLGKANLAIADRALKADGLAQNLQYLYRLESEEGVKYIDLRPTPRAAPPPPPAAKAGAKPATPPPVIFVPLNYTISIEGDFTQIISFLRRLEQGIYFSRINTASISSAAGRMTAHINVDLLGMP